MPREELQVMSDKEEQDEAPSPDTYQVGYGKPPKQARFKKGRKGDQGRLKRICQSVASFAEACRKKSKATLMVSDEI
jgi:hypothetical protein